MNHSIIIFDAEISTPIVTDKKGQEQHAEQGIAYARSFTDWGRLRISVLGAPTFGECLLMTKEELYAKSMWFTFDHLANCEYYFDQFALHVSFNGDAFDSPMLNAHGVFLDPSKSYDLLAELRKASRGKGASLDALAAANGLPGKSGEGARAPYDWLAGKYQQVTTYCMNDCKVLALLLEKVINGEPLKHPKTGEDVRLRNPLERGGLF